MARLQGGKVAELQSSKVKSTIRNPKSEIEPCKSYWTLVLSLLVLPLLARAERVYRAMPQLPVSEPVELPSLSIISPARNEAHKLSRLLPALLGQRYPGDLELIIVDDHSSDETAEVVQCEFQNWKLNTKQCKLNTKQCKPRLIQAQELPPGWLGKPHASHMGACAARGQWLLFTDADTEHEATCAASAVAYAEAHDLDGLSIFLQQETRGLWDSAVLMVAFAGLFSGLRQSSPTMNGQFVLLRRAVYEASGGFAAVRGEMMDDLAFGKLLADQGFHAPMMRGEALARVHMYANRRQMWHGVSRLGTGSLRYSGLTALLPALFITGVMTPLWTLLFERRHLRAMPRLWVIWLTAVLGFIPWAKRFYGKQKTENKKWKTVLRALMAPPAAVFLQTSTVWGFVSRRLGQGILWKTRKV